jgi:hypothetical protein
MPKPPSTLQAVQESPTAEGSSEQRDVTLYGITPTEGENPRANYHRLIACAVKELDRSTSEARDAVYERARTALIAHLRLNQAGLLKADIVKERLALEGAIREIEAEAARKSRTEMPIVLRPKTPRRVHPMSMALPTSPRTETAIRARLMCRRRACPPCSPMSNRWADSPCWKR